MPLAISNIAWPFECERQVPARIAARGVTGVEVAPTKVWEQPLEVSRLEATHYRQFWEGHGLRIVALQSLLYGQQHLQLFQGAALREATFDYLAGMIRLANWLGAEVLVFGSPKNRLVGEGSYADAQRMAVDFFRKLGQLAQELGVWFCIEPNPVQYGCDFLTTAAAGLTLVEAVNQPGFGLHLDAAGMTLAGDDARQIMASAGNWWRHFHVSEPFLLPIGSGATPHHEFSTAIEHSQYSRWLSIEMKTVDAAENPIASVEAALDACWQQYACHVSRPAMA